MIPKPKSGRTIIHNVSGFTTGLLKDFLYDGAIIEHDGDHYKYKGTTKINSDNNIIRVKNNNDIEADLIFSNI